MEFNSLDQLQDGTRALVQIARRDNADGDAPDWSEPITVTLYVRRRDRQLKWRGRVYPAGQIIELTPREFGWASYTAEDFCPDFNEFLAEEYRMKILEIR